MSILSAEDQLKLEALTALIVEARRGGPDVAVTEVVAVDWPAPDGRAYYAATLATDVWPPLRDKLDGADVEPRLLGGAFLDVMRDSGVSDDSVALNLWDADHAISDLFETHGEGVRVEVFFYFPDVDLLLSQWHGHLRPPEDADEEAFTATAENGFMSVQLPLPRRAFFSTCQAVDGLLLQTQAEIDEGGCPRNMHIGGSVGVPGMELHRCPRRTRQDCIDHIGDDLSWMGFDRGVGSYPVGSRGVIATSRGNETRLKRPLRVIAGKRTIRDPDLLKYVVETGNPSHPERGSIKLLYALAERTHWLGQPKANNAPVQAQHYATRTGRPRQARIGFTNETGNYSNTSLLHMVLQGDFRNVDPTGIKVEMPAEGDDSVRVYGSEDPEDFTEGYSTDRAWWLLHAYRHKWWGLGADVRRFVMQDFIDLSDWFSETTTYKAADGTAYTGPRSTFNAELIDRSAQQQINDICLAGRCTVPFPWEGKLRVFTLKKLSDEELAAAPVFTDGDESGFERNIVREGEKGEGKSTLRRSSLSDRDLPNAIKVTIDNDATGNQEEPLIFDDEEQQLRAGRAFGDTGRREVEKPYSLLGVTNVGEASRLGILLRDLGEFDEGGLANNQRVTFQTFITHALTLYKSKVIRVLSRSLVNRRTGVQQFEYFRVRSVRKLPDLLVEVSAQAYPVEYYAKTEDLVPGVTPGEIIPFDPSPDDNPGGLPGSRPRPVVITDVETGPDRIEIVLSRS
jgi:hypothetical protein